MTFRQLLKANTWPTISSLFIETYPDADKDMAGYKTVFEKLLIMDAVETNMSIVITKERNDNDEYVEVSGLHNYPKNKEETYSQGIEFTPWREWLGMDISKESLTSFSELEIIIHCLYEMTFVGFTEEVIQEKIRSIEKSRKESKSMTKAERDGTTISAEEFFKEWREKDNN